MFPYSYTVVMYDEYDEINKVSLYRRESGMGLAESFSAATKQLEDYYGDDLVSIKHLELFEENSVILLPEHVIENYARAEGYYCQAPHCDAFGNPYPVARQVECVPKSIEEVKEANGIEC